MRTWEHGNNINGRVFSLRAWNQRERLFSQRSQLRVSRFEMEQRGTPSIRPFWDSFLWQARRSKSRVHHLFKLFRSWWSWKADFFLQKWNPKHEKRLTSNQVWNFVKICGLKKSDACEIIHTFTRKRVHVHVITNVHVHALSNTHARARRRWN